MGPDDDEVPDVRMRPLYAFVFNMFLMNSGKTKEDSQKKI
jgi:hypothetical protein